MALKFRGVDFIDFDSLLSEDEILVRDTTRKFVEDNVIPGIEQWNRDGVFPRELVRPMGDLGFYGASLKGYGCAEMSNVEYGLVMQELERGDSGLRSFVSVQSALVMYPIYAFGSDEQKDRWLPAMAKGEKLGCFGLTEPDAGSNPGAMRTRARKDGNEYVLNGEKMWITSGSIADVAVIWAKVDDEGGKVRGFLVETDRPGFKAADVHGKWSLRASVTSSLSLQDVRIPAANILPKSDGLKSRAHVPESGALWHRLGRRRRGHGRLRLRAAVLAVPQTVSRSAHRFASDGAGEAGLDDQRDQQGAAAGAARRPP